MSKGQALEACSIGMTINDVHTYISSFIPLYKNYYKMAIKMVPFKCSSRLSLIVNKKDYRKPISLPNATYDHTFHAPYSDLYTNSLHD